eukprot:scaffold4365_cov147-Skeletonema_menzelii.AAC.14
MRRWDGVELLCLRIRVPFLWGRSLLLLLHCIACSDEEACNLRGVKRGRYLSNEWKRITRVSNNLSVSIKRRDKVTDAQTIMTKRTTIYTVSQLHLRLQQTYQNSAKAHVALQYLQISVTYPRSQYFHQCILFIWNGGQRMVGKEGAIVEEFGGLGFFGVDDEGLHCGGERRTIIEEGGGGGGEGEEEAALLVRWWRVASFFAGNCILSTLSLITCYISSRGVHNKQAAIRSEEL